MKKGNCFLKGNWKKGESLSQGELGKGNCFLKGNEKKGIVFSREIEKGESLSQAIPL